MHKISLFVQFLQKHPKSIKNEKFFILFFIPISCTKRAYLTKKTNVKTLQVKELQGNL